VRRWTPWRVFDKRALDPWSAIARSETCVVLALFERYYDVRFVILEVRELAETHSEKAASIGAREKNLINII